MSMHDTMMKAKRPKRVFSPSDGKICLLRAVLGQLRPAIHPSITWQKLIHVKRGLEFSTLI